MAGTWANSGVDLHLDLAAQAGAPAGPDSGRRGTRVRAGLEAALRAAVRDGRLRPGSRLPASRGLARDLGLARNTVADAYGQLVAEGWLEARTGSGTWVAERPVQATSAKGPALAAPASPRYDLRAGIPAVSAFPRAPWLAACRAAISAADEAALGYPDPRGVPQLREAIAGYLARARGVVASPERVIVCAGFAHGLAMVCQVLSERGVAAIAAEAYGHRLHRRIARSQGVVVSSLPVDPAGAVPDAIGRDVGAVVLTPGHQYPLGMTLAPARRAAFIRWAAQAGSLVVEDDYDGEFRYDRQPVGAMQALAPDHVIYAGTASKSLAPGLRLGWLVVPETMIDELVAVKETSGFCNGTLDQLALAGLIGSGGYDRQIRQARLTYRRRRDRLISALASSVPSVGLTGIAAGLHAVAELPPGQTEQDVVDRATAHGVAVDGLGDYTADGHERAPALVIGYGRPAEHAFSTAIGRLCAALADGG
jgi:GntR family transcriptional regulator / MocR family aminotransferase